MRREFWMGKRVFLTGHTGFKGGWLSLWLSNLGAEVYGYSLCAQNADGIYNVAKISDCMVRETIADIRDSDKLRQALLVAQPEIIIHMAAQPLVRKSYTDPLETFSVNVMGLLCLLEAVRSVESVSAFLNITTDKCYENNEGIWPYRENDKLGGKDPYSASKACAELLSACYRQSYLEKQGVAIATARAGNVIGGGDQSEDRLIPDFLRAADQKIPLVLRNPAATRPWQHVLEPLSGYLTLGERLIESELDYSEPWNFGPLPQDVRSVQNILQLLVDFYKCGSWQLEQGTQPYEAQTLSLDSTKSKVKLGWTPKWSINKALCKTLDWHTDWRNGCDMARITINQIKEYEI